MLGHLRGNLFLLVLSLLICCGLYPLTVLGIAKLFFPDQAEGSLIDEKGQPVTDPAKALGSRLIAQPFGSDEYFQPRPSAVSYNAAASGASNWGANNYLLRDRVARQLGPIVKYKSSAKKGQLVAPDIESWLQKDQFQGRPGLVSQWAQAHSTQAQNWVKADKMNGEYVMAWQKDHPDAFAQWKKDNPDNAEPKPEDLAVPFFTSYSTTNPGTFPGVVEHKTADGKTESKIEPVKEGGSIASLFFDMWRQDNPDEQLEAVPADMVMASGSGLDPDITLKNALYQLDRVAGAWAKKTNGDEAKIRQEIEQLLNAKATAPLAGLAGVKLVTVLEMNLALRNRFGSEVAPETATPAAAQARPAPTDAAVEPAATSAPTRPDTTADSTAPQSQIGDVSNQIKELLNRFNEHTEAVAQDKAVRDKTLAELNGLEERVAKLAGDARDVSQQLVGRVGGLEARVKSATESLEALQTEVGETRDALNKQFAATTTPRPEPGSVASPTGGEEKAKSEPDLAPGLEAFSKGRYAEAASMFRALTRSDPDDARSWYYAALANGLATGQWRGETETLVNKGVERERAGTPSASEIDALFTGLAKESGGDWLTFYRRQASNR